MSSIGALKAQIQRESLLKESGKKTQTRTSGAGLASVARTRVPPFMSRNLNKHAARATGAQVKLEPRSDDLWNPGSIGVAGPSKVVFKGPKGDASSRKKRACE